LSEVNDAHTLLREQKILGRGVLIPWSRELSIFFSWSIN
jgi:hypothetical protein